MLKFSDNNPFILSGYEGAEYFCDRKNETETLVRELTNGNNVALISTRRMGKTGLIQHCFAQSEIKKNCNTFFIDIYATKSLRDFTFLLGKIIFEQLKPVGKKALEEFLKIVKSFQSGISFDVSGAPTFYLSLGDIQNPQITLEEIFFYIKNSSKPCILAIDEFQQIITYPEGNVEALLRTHIQHCNNAKFIFAGSQRHIMGNMFLSPSRPFYQSVSIIHLQSIDLEEYTKFAIHHFSKNKKEISSETVQKIYDMFDGITWYVQKILHTLYNSADNSEQCGIESVLPAVEYVIKSNEYTYSETLYRLPAKQKELLVAIAKEGMANGVTSANFVKKYKLISASSVQSALKGLFEKDFITQENNVIQVYDRFFGMWLKKNY